MGSLIETRRRIMLDTSHLETASGSVASFHTDMKSKLKECKLYFSPVQSGSGDPSPDNVRPISGRNSITITHCGKNILDLESLFQHWESLYTKTGDDSYFVRATGVGCRKPFEFFDDDTIVSMNGSVTDSENAARWRFELLNKNGTRVGLLGALSGNSSGIYQVPNVSANKYRLNYGTAGAGATFENIQVELGTECTEYESYKGTDLQIDWSDLGTKYGGYVDLVSGELVIDHSILTIDGTANWKVVSTNKFYYEDIGADVFDYQESIGELSNLYPYSGTAQSGSNKVTINKSFYLQHSPASTVQDTWYNRVWVYDTDYTFSTFKDMLNSTALQVTYKMRYSQTYQLTPQTIKTLIGRNNIWSDAGDVEVTYWTH